MSKVKLKTEEEIKIMQEGGAILARVKKKLKPYVKVGANAWEIEELANKFIEEEGAEASFKKVPRYKWATCINVNDGVVHGIPRRDVVFKEGDILSVDLGVYYKGFHTDTAFSVYLGDDPKVWKFFETGRQAVKAGIAQVKKGRTIGQISAAIEDKLVEGHATPVWALTGHGVGKDLHEYPPIPCFVAEDQYQKLKITPGMVLAVEVMYTLGNGEIKQDFDGWTIRTKDGKISALFEETVALSGHGPIVLTA
jgi:methionyl aminopeptidase